jgi:hypothetical protein
LVPWQIPAVHASTQFEGWLWRKTAAARWIQQYSVIYEGVLFFFPTVEQSDKFKAIAGRSDDGMFLAAPLADSK